MTEPMSARRTALIRYAIWMFVALAYFMPAATWNPVSRYDLTRSIVERHTLDIEPFHDSTGDRALVDGRWYSEKAPGSSLLAIVPYALYYAATSSAQTFAAVGPTADPVLRVRVNDAFRRGLYVSSVTTSAVAGTLVAVLLFVLLRRRHSTKIAWTASTLTVLATPLFPYSTSMYGHVVAAACLLGAVAWPTLASRRDDPRRLPPAFVGAGACLATAVACEYLVAIPAVVLGVWLVARHRDSAPRVVGALAAGALVPVLLVSLYHWAAFGAPWRTGYAFVTRAEFAQGHARGLLGLGLPRLEALWGLLYSTRRGLFYLSPVALVAVAALWFRRKDGLVRAMLVAAALMTLANAGYYMWWGGAAAGPRHLVPVLPVVGFGLAAALCRPRWRALAVATAVPSIAAMTLLTAVGFEAPEQGNAVTNYALPAFTAGKLAYMSGASNLGVELGLPRAGSLGPWLAWLLLGARWVWRALPDEPQLAASTNAV